MLYILHFSEPYKHAKHYVGFTDDFNSRMASHRNGTGARLIKVILEAGIDFEAFPISSGDRKAERKIKNQKNAARFCPKCKAMKES